MRKIKYILILLVLFSIHIEKSWGQNIDQYLHPNYNTDYILPNTPSATVFGRYGQYPVDLKSGLVDISIPLYTIKTKQLQLPISLSYHMSGIKVSDIASPIGLGWTLHAGGMITVQIRGKSDFLRKNDEAILSENELNKLTSKELSNKLRDAHNNNYDTGSDLYFYNVNSISGSFTYDTKGNLIQIPISDHKIEKLKDSNNNFIGFKIIGTDGTKYYFQEGGSVKRISEKSSEINSYNLEKIVSADSKDSILFKYEKTSSYTDYPPVFSAEKGKYFDIESNTLGSQIVYSGLQTSYINSKIDYSESILTKIIFDGGEVQFTTEDTRKDRVKSRYTGLKVKSSLDQSCVLSVDLLHDYFESEGDSDAKKEYPDYFYRLKLQGLKIKPCSQDDFSNNYYFYYNSTNLPPYDYSYYYYPKKLLTSYPIDLWGYYNNQYNKHTLLPRDDDSDTEFQKITGSSSNRKVVEQYARACILEKIVYPTGGSSIFDTESNRLGGSLVGGLRVNRVSSYDEKDNHVEEKNYHYSGGYLIDLQSHSKRFSGVVQMYTYTNRYGNYVDFSKQIYTSNIFNYQAVGGCPIFYSNVTEYIRGAGVDSGKKEYKYQYVPNEIHYRPGSGSEYLRYYTLITDNFWQRGNLLEENIYKKVNNNYELIQSTVNQYKLFKTKQYIIGNVITQSYINLASDVVYIDPYKEFHWADQYIYNGINLLTSSITKEYLNGTLTVTKNERYNYDKLLSSVNAHTQLTQKIIEKSDKDSIITRFIYPLDISLIGSSGTDLSVVKQFQDKNVISTPIEIINYKKIGNDTPLATDALFFKFKGINQLSEILKLNSDIPLMYTGTSSVSGNGYNYNTKYTKSMTYEYDSRNNIKQYINKELPVSILWSYNYRYPIAKMENVYIKDIEQILNTNTLALNLNPNIKDIQNNLYTKLSDKDNIQISMYEYKPLVGVARVADARGLSKTYLYDDLGRLSQVLDNVWG